MALFQPAENTSAFLKMGLLGFAGSGKTYTASIAARDLVLHMKKLGIAYANKPAMFLDTETGSDWVRPLFEKAGIPLHVAKTRSFSDLLVAVREAEANASVLIIDSITHFWKELCDSYVTQKSERLSRKANKPIRARLEFQDWGYLKGEWAKFTDLYINSGLHIVLAGRAGFEYDYFENDDGKKELEKTGVKMKAEGEMGYEPSLLVLMERNQRIESGSVAETWREGTVLKDRSTLLDGKVFRDPKFSDFQPHIERLNLGGKQLGVDTSRTTVHAIADGSPRDSAAVQRRIVIGELSALLFDAFPGQTKDDKLGRANLCRKHFQNEEMTWERIEEVLPLVDLRLGYDSMYREIKSKPSQYAALFADAPASAADDGIPGFLQRKPAINDSLPDHSAAPATQPDQQPALSLKEKLLADLPNQKTMTDTFHWGQQVAGMDGLSPQDRLELSSALLAHQANLHKAAGEDAEGDKKPRSKKNGKPAPVDTGSDGRSAHNVTGG